MTLLKRLQFILKHDIQPEYIVYDFANQMPVRFLDYKEARAFADSQFMYNPKVMVEIK